MTAILLAFLLSQSPADTVAVPRGTLVELNQRIRDMESLMRAQDFRIEQLEQQLKRERTRCMEARR